LEEHGWWRYTLFSSGINMDEHTRHQAKGLMACSIVYLLAQIPGLRSGCAAVDIAGDANCDSNAAEKACAMIGSVLSFLFLAYYFKKQLSINSRGFEEHQRQHLLPDNYQAASDAGDVNVPLPAPPPAADKEVQLIPMMKRPSLWVAALMLLMGAVIVCIYTVPLVDCLGTLSDRATISPFYASFLLVPIATNVAEFVVAFGT
jgi:Ca2+/H+ antiporter